MEHRRSSVVGGSRESVSHPPISCSSRFNPLEQPPHTRGFGVCPHPARRLHAPGSLRRGLRRGGSKPPGDAPRLRWLGGRARPGWGVRVHGRPGGPRGFLLKEAPRPRGVASRYLPRQKQRQEKTRIEVKGVGAGGSGGGAGAWRARGRGAVVEGALLLGRGGAIGMSG